jgi:hypothetical protein
MREPAPARRSFNPLRRAAVSPLTVDQAGNDQQALGEVERVGEMCAISGGHSALAILGTRERCQCQRRYMFALGLVRSNGPHELVAIDRQACLYR